MAKRNPIIEKRFEEWIGQGLTARRAYTKYITFKTWDEFGIDRPVSFGRFRNLFYEIKKKMKKDAEESIKPLGNIKVLTTDSESEGKSGSTGSHEFEEYLKIDPAAAASPGMPYTLMDVTYKEEHLGAWREIHHFYRKYNLLDFLDESSPRYTEEVRPLNLSLLKWYIRLRNLSYSAEFASSSQEMLNKVRLLRILGAEHLTIWEGLTENGLVDCRRPQVENIFYTEFWTGNEEEFEDRTENIGGSSNGDPSRQNLFYKSPMAEFLEQWVIIAEDTKTTLGDIKPQIAGEYTFYKAKEDIDIADPNKDELLRFGLSIDLPSDLKLKEYISGDRVDFLLKYVPFLRNERHPLSYFMLNSRELLGRDFVISNLTDLASDELLKEWALEVTRGQHADIWPEEGESLEKQLNIRLGAKANSSRVPKAIFSLITPWQIIAQRN